MALFVDFVGLNTLIQEPVNVDTNTIGSSAASRPSSGSTDTNEVRNTQIQTIQARDYLAALNSHRNGPYGYPVFRQLRTSDSPILRRQRLTNIFSHYEYPGQTIIHTTGKDIAAETFIHYRRMPTDGEKLVINIGGEIHNIFFLQNNGGSGTDASFDSSSEPTLNILIAPGPSPGGTDDTLEKLTATIASRIDAKGLTNIASVRTFKRPDGTFTQRIRSLTKGEGTTIVKTDASLVRGIRAANRAPQSEKVRHVVNPKRGPVEHFSEVPVVSKHRPLRVFGSVTSTDEQGRESLERVQVYTTLGNETQYFSNPKINKFFNTEEILADDYEDFVDLYLEGGIDGDESPLDEFRFMQYKQVVYPKELYTYKNHTRNRINFVSRYWRDNRLDRTSIFEDNGFGFRIISQSAWVLDAEENFRDLSFIITPGNLTLRHPNTFTTTKALTTNGTNTDTSGSVESFVFKNSGNSVANMRSISIVGLDHDSLGTLHPRQVYGYNGYPYNMGGTAPVHKVAGTKALVSVNPYDASTGIMQRLYGAEGVGLRGAFEDRGFKVKPTITERYVRFVGVENNFTKGFGITLEGAAPGVATTSRSEWRLRTTASSLSTWLGPPAFGPDLSHNAIAASDSNISLIYPSGTLYHEVIGVTGSDGTTTKKVSKAICFDPADRGQVVIKLGTTFTASHDGSLIYCGANEPGAIEYRTNNAFGVDNPIYKAARTFNSDMDGNNDADRRKASSVAVTSTNHFLFELNLSGSRPDLALGHSLSAADLKLRGAHFRARHGHVDASPIKKQDPSGYAKVYINGSASFMASAHDPYKFLSGSQGNFQQQLRGGNSSLRLSGGFSMFASLFRNQFRYENTDWPSLNPFTAQGFAFSYWIKFSVDPLTIDATNLIFAIQDGTSTPIIDHRIGGDDGSSRSTIRITFGGDSGGAFIKDYSAKYQFDTETWYNITFSTKKNGSNMDGVLQVRKKGQTSPESLISSQWSSGVALTYAQFSSMESSAKLYVLSAGSGASGKLVGGAASSEQLDHVNIDSLVFFNGGLDSSGGSSDQFKKLINTTKYGEPHTINSSDFPATDSTTAIQATAQGGTMIHGRATYELNTFRDTKFGLSTGRLAEREDRYFPFGSDYRANEFQSGVLDAGDAGEFDMSFWFRSSHENFRNRSIRSTRIHEPHINNNYQHFSTAITKRSEMYKGLFICFWFRRNGNYSTGASTTIMKCADDSFGIVVNRDGGLGVGMTRRLTFWTKGQGVSPAGQDRFNYFVGPLMPNDSEWHFVSVYWNGKSGPEQQAAFQIDDAPTPTFSNGGIQNHYNWGTTSYSYVNPEEDSQPLFQATGEGSNIEVLSSVSYTFPQQGNNAALSMVQDTNIAQLTVITNPTNPAHFTNAVRNTIYSNGQYYDIGSTNQITTALSNAAVNYGTAEIKNTLGNVHLFSIDADNVCNGKYKLWRLVQNSTSHNQFFIAEAPASDTWAPAAANQAGGFTLSFYFRAVNGSATQWKGASMWWLFRINDSSGKRVMEGYKSTYTSGPTANKLTGFIDFGNGQTGNYSVNDFFDDICDGEVHHLVFSYNGRTNGSGTIVDFKVFIDGTEKTVVGSTNPSNANSTSANLRTPTELIIGASSKYGYNSFPYTFSFGAIKFFKQALPDQNNILDSLAYIDRADGLSNKAHAFLKDPQWYFPQLSPQTVPYNNGASNLSGVNILGPIVDCMISPDNDIYSTTNALEIQNRANKTPTLEHYYALGTEAEIRETPIHDFLPITSINNSGSASDAPFSISCFSQVDTGPKHWEVEWYSFLGDVDPETGLEESRNAYQQENQQLFFVGDQFNNSIPRNNLQGIELYLSSSGGGYAIESAIGLVGSPELITTTAENLISPNKWYHLYASYSGCTSGGTPALNLYLNGQLLTMTTKQNGGGTFDVLAGTAYRYRPTIGGSGDIKVRPFAGYFQDIAFWNKNNTNRALACRNVYDGIRPGSTYINTSDSDLEVVHKTGFLAGDSPAQLTKVGGSHVMDGSSHSGLSSTSRAFITGPPIESLKQTGPDAVTSRPNNLVMAFWAGLQGNAKHDILTFFSDAKYSRNDLLSSDFYTAAGAITAPNSGLERISRFVEKTDTSGRNKNDQSIRLSVQMVQDVAKKYILRVFEAPLHESNLRNVAGGQLQEIVREVNSNVVRDTTGELVHNVIIFSQDSLKWYQNGSLVGDQSFSSYGNVDNDAGYYTIGGDSIPEIKNGWNNVLVGSEDFQFRVNSILDEVAILHYDHTSLPDDAAKNALAASLYNGGAVYNYNIRKDNLYAWWRMGENVAGSPISVGTSLIADQKINDDSGKPAGAENDLYNNFNTRFQTVSRASGTGLDIKNLYLFNNTDNNNSNLPDSTAVAQPDSVGGRQLNKVFQSGQSSKWSHDFSYDSYELHPLNWLACEGNLVESIFLGASGTPGLARLQHHNDGSQNDRFRVSDAAIFTGVSTTYTGGSSLTNNDKTKAKTIIKFNEMPASGDSLTLIMNPRSVGSNPTRELLIRFSITGGVDTSFTAAGGSGGGPTPASAANIKIDDVTASTVADLVERIKELLQHSTGLDDDGLSLPDNYIITTSSSNTIVIIAETDFAGKDGEYEVTATYNGSSTKTTISNQIGYSHISKALSRTPNFGWNRMDDTPYSRGGTTNNISTSKQGLFPESDGNIKPFVYYLETNNGKGVVGDYRNNIGTGGASFNLNVNTGNLGITGFDTEYGIDGVYFLDSGSTAQLILENTPSLDFNDITFAPSLYFNDTSLPLFSSPGAPKSLVGGKTGARSRFGPGLLQNSYNQFAQNITKGPSTTIDPQLSASACYFRRHSLTASTSFVTRNGGFLQKLSASHNLNSSRTALIGNMSASHLFLGSAKWEAGDFAGTFTDDGTFVSRPKKPFYDTYKDFVADARPIMKDYGIVPEFRISEHVTDYIRKGPTQQKLNFLHITGGLASADSSEKPDFFKIYSTTDFLKHFEVVQEDHADFVDPFAITLRCNVVKKFLPYEGFYPAQRSVQVAQQFYSSYSDNINVSTTSGTEYDLSTENKYPFQYLLNPLFSPGIMFNTIKSGVAVDYPLITDTGSVRRVGVGDGTINGGAMIREQFDTRIPFEALVEPEKHLANITLAGNEPDENANTGLEVQWGGQGDPLYNLMVSNFLAETSEFFLENKSFTSLASLSQGDANFGNAQKGNIYMMRLKMFRSTRGNKPAAENHLSKSYGVPQDQGAMTEAFTMYSRPSAFGPPQLLSGSGFTALTWADFKFDGTSGSILVEDEQSPYFDLKGLPFQHDFSYVTGSTYGNIPVSGAIGNQAHLGYNFPFTPPYYHGEAWADITFIPRETKKYSLQEIINQSSVEFYRYYAGQGTIASDGFSLTTDTPTPHDPTKKQTIANKILRGGANNTISHVHDRTVVINDQAMQIASSVNIFSQGVLEQDISAQGASGISDTTNVQVDTDIQNKYRWIIQTKFETPMLNFNHYTYGKHTNATTRNGYAAKSDGTNHNDGSTTLPKYTDNTFGIELPGVGPQQTPIGMWHQYGHLPQRSSEGVFLQVDDVPNSWISNAMNRPPAIMKRHRSLASLCGFSTDPVRMGEVAGVKEISEAVVAIPFFESGGVRRFFNMKKEQIDFALDPSKTNLVGRTIRDMVNKMQKFVIPPSLDFIRNRQIKPFSMYIFEFTHNLTKQDLADIWQNLPPELNETVQTDQATISHQLLAYELLGRGGSYRKGVNSDLELIRNDRDTSVNPQIQWMVFKVKQRAKTNYFEKIFARNESQQLLAQRLRLGVSADALGRRTRISYNWPYDFFSMIEGVKLTAEVNFLDFDEEASQQQEKPVIKPKTKSPDSEDTQRKAVSKRMFGAVSGLVPPQELRNKTEVPSGGLIGKKGKITRPRRVQIDVNNISNRIKQVTNSIGGKKIK